LNHFIVSQGGTRAKPKTTTQLPESAPRSTNRHLPLCCKTIQNYELNTFYLYCRNADNAILQHHKYEKIHVPVFLYSYEALKLYVHTDVAFDKMLQSSENTQAYAIPVFP
jgi:hypothetical protein